MPKVDKGECHNDEEARTKAAAWAWYERAGGSAGKGVKSEAVAIRRAGARRPSRFKLELEAQARQAQLKRRSFDSVYGKRTNTEGKSDMDFLCPNEKWDCGSSLFDSFELVRMSKELDRGLTAPAEKPIRRSAVASTNRKPDAGKTNKFGRKHQQSGVLVRMPGPVFSSLERWISLPDPDSHPSGNLSCKPPYDKSDACKKTRDSELTYIHQEKPRHRISFNGLSKALHYIAHLPSVPHGDLHQSKYYHHGHEHKNVHHHHHHHHHYFVPTDNESRSPELNKSLMLAGAALRVKISPLPLHFEAPRNWTEYQ